MQSEMNASLPGGLILDGSLEKCFSFGPVDGVLEISFLDDHRQTSSLPQKISDLLCRALDSLGGRPVSMEKVKSLSVGDRQYLVKELAVKLGKDLNWVSACCRACNKKMDLSFRYSELPVKQASEKFPEFSLKMGRKNFSVRVPVGEDQEILSSHPDSHEALNVLLDRLVKSVSKGAKKEGNVFSLSEVKKIEDAVEDASPEVGTTLLACCPYCAAENHVQLDLYRFIFSGSSELLSEIHSLASHYHWSEEEILNLPRARRKNYLLLIDRSKGMSRTA